MKTGDTTFLSYGFLSTTPGDVNGDGYCDILYYGNERSWAGRAYLFYGGNNLDTIPDAVFSNSNGYDAVCMGDFNGDDFDDIALGNQNGPDGNGRVYIYLGGNPMDTICDFQIRGPQGGSLFGQAISSGDANGDSYTDLIVGAYGAAPMPGGYDMGVVFIYFGGPNFDTIPDVILNGGHENDREGFGTSVSGAGNVNKDGFSDIIISAGNFGSRIQGRVYIYFGGNPMDTIYDVALSGEQSWEQFGWDGVDFLENTTEYDHAVIGSSLWGQGSGGYRQGRVCILFGGTDMDSIPDVILIGRTDSSRLGNSIATAGFISGNEANDLIVGAPTEYRLRGTSYAWHGGASLDTIPDAWLRGVQFDDGIGWGVASAGDVNGDGKDEVLVSNYAVNETPKRAWVCKYTGPGIEENRLMLTANRIPIEITPNPAKSQTAISFSLSATSKISLKVYDITGKLVKTLDTEQSLFEAGSYEIRWDLRNNNQKKVAAGIYFIEVTTDDGKEARKEMGKIMVVK